MHQIPSYFSQNRIKSAHSGKHLVQKSVKCCGLGGIQIKAASHSLRNILELLLKCKAFLSGCDHNAALVIGLAACYAFGTAWFMFVYIRNTGPVGVMTVLSWCVFPFIIPDIVKMALAVVISRRVRGILR